MSNDIDQLIIEFFVELPRQGPGNEEATFKALNKIVDKLPSPTVAADLGCGTGSQTLTLLTRPRIEVTSVDLHLPFLDKLDQSINRLQYQDRAKTMLGDFSKLSFAAQSLDLIWSEGAIYNLGFEEGLKYWAELLKYGGFMMVSEAVWITKSPDVEAQDYWNKEYPGISSVPEKISVIEKTGLKLLTHFTLPVRVWWDSYYLPVQGRINAWKDVNKGIEFVDLMQYEIDMFKRFEGQWSYEYFVMQKS